MAGVVISYSYGSGEPDGLYTGLRAVTQQPYTEANKKNGTEWEASRRLVGATLGQKYYSIIKTGLMPVILKSREFGFTGNGVIARIYTGFTPVTLPAPDPVYNMRSGFEADRDFTLYAISAPTTLGVKIGADDILEGNTSNQGRGVAHAAVGSDRILGIPNTEYLLEIESLDAQNIGVRIEMYNGWVDLPRPA